MSVLICFPLLPVFHIGTQIQFEGPGVPWLPVQHPVVVSDVFGFKNAVEWHAAFVFAGHKFADKVGIHRAINDHMSNVNIFGPNSRAMLCASARKACLAPAKAAKPAAPRAEAVAPVKIMLPRPRGTMRSATSRAVKKPEKQAISQILKYLRAVSSRMEHGTLAPMLNTITSTGPMSLSIWLTSAFRGPAGKSVEFSNSEHNSLSYIDLIDKQLKCHGFDLLSQVQLKTSQPAQMLGMVR